MNDNLEKRVLEMIARHSMIRPGDRVGVGVSGGADSVALLHLLAELRAKIGITIFVLHFNHQLRGVDSDDDECFVKAEAAKLGGEFLSNRANVAAEARRNGWNLEDAARRLRYQFFSEAADFLNLNRVAVAHSSDDQAETVLAHLLRGTGLAGLAGIYPVAGRIVRPLLEIRREELREYLSGLGCVWREDATNQDTSRVRARIRHELLPVLEKNFESSSVVRLARLAGLAREDETFWRALEDERFSALTIRDASGNLSLRVADLLCPLPALADSEGKTNCGLQSRESSTVALSRRLVRRIVADLRGSRQQLTAGHVRSVLALATKSSSGARIELPGILVERTFDRVVFSTASAPARGIETPICKGEFSGCEFEYSVSEPGASKTSSIVVPEIRRRFDLKVIDWQSASRETIRYRGILDFDRLRWPLVLRNWRPGDSYCPHGRRHNRKLKRLFLESRIPRTRRATWPVLTSAGELVWASGYPAAEEFAPHAGTLAGLVIAEEGLPGEPQESM